jgi:exosortase
LSLAALAALFGGRAALVRYWPPIVFLLFMIPLPYEASRLMGAELQRIATIASTFLLQCAAQPAIAEGNRILIGDVTLNVVEACSGLRMLMTFFAFSTAAVLVMERHWLVKALVLASAIPIALLVNMTRIVITAILYLILGPDSEVAQHFFHDLAGWFMMPLALGLGAGAELQRPLALAVIGGLTLSTCFSWK